MENGFISKIQRYSTKDGPGLRSTVFTVGCGLNCLWCSNPELIADGSKILYHPERCRRCGACAALSGGAILLGENGCVIDREACKNLDECASACYYDAYETIGYYITSGELVKKLARDKVFYDQSGGGVTFSGGEPALQSGFVAETSRLLRDMGIHVALDTSGYVPWDKLKEAAENADLILYDIKAFEPGIHLACTGADNRMILENALKLAEMKKDMIIRMIIAPGYNNQPADIDARLAFVQSLGSAVKQTDILKMHNLGAGKYRSLGVPCPTEGSPGCTDEAAREAALKAERLGLKAVIGG